MTAWVVWRGVGALGSSAATLCRNLEGTLVFVDFDHVESKNLTSRTVLSAHCRRLATPLVHAGLAGDGTFGLVRWDERFTPDAEDHAGPATCEGGAHLPLIGLLSATLVRTVQDFVAHGERRDSMVSLTSAFVVGGG